MNEKTAYVHIGTHKTGTSAFQQWLRNNKMYFDEIGIHVPASGSGRTGNYASAARSVVLTGDDLTEGWVNLREIFIK